MHDRIPLVKYAAFFVQFDFLKSCSYRKELLNLDKLEAQLKACNCRLVFSKAKVSKHNGYSAVECHSKVMSY